MSRQKYVAAFGALLLVAGALSLYSTAADSRLAAKESSPVDFFDAMDEGMIEAKFIARSDRDARVIITNKGNQPINLQLPQAFAGVPVLAQVGGARGGGGFGGGGNRGGGGGGNQSVGGGMMGGGGGMMGGGGMFSVPADQTVKINVPVLCLDHGKDNPSSSNPYKIVPAAAHIDRPEVIELLKGFGTGKMDHGAAQAAAWHLNNDMSWEELAAKLEGTKRSTSRAPYFNTNQIAMARRVSQQAALLAAENREEHELAAAKAKEREEKLAAKSSEERSTEADEANEPKEDAAADEEQAEHEQVTADATADAGA